MINMTILKNIKHRQNDAYETGIGTQFNAETNKRDEDEEMYIYIYTYLFIYYLYTHMYRYIFLTHHCYYLLKIIY